MTRRSSKLLLWSPRVLGILVCLFLSVFALDAFQGGKTVIEALPDFGGHIAPMLILLAIVAVSWRWEWVGALVFTGLGVGYAYVARDHLSWIPVIAGPLLVVGILFFWSWVHHKADRATV
jgi:glucose-6-phosphate-specific signal transduction histidine kinase